MITMREVKNPSDEMRCTAREFKALVRVTGGKKTEVPGGWMYTQPWSPASLMRAALVEANGEERWFLLVDHGPELGCVK